MRGNSPFPRGWLSYVDKVRKFLASVPSFHSSSYITGHTDDCFVSTSTQTLNTGMFQFPHGQPVGASSYLLRKDTIPMV